MINDIGIDVRYSLRESEIARLKARVALLEAVAEALVQQYYSNPYVTMHLAVYEALRAAGYLKEQGDE